MVIASTYVIAFGRAGYRWKAREVTFPASPLLQQMAPQKVINFDAGPGPGPIYGTVAGKGLTG